MPKKLRIAQFITATWAQPQPPDIIFAPVNLVLELNKKLESLGHEVTLYAPEGSHSPTGKLETLGFPPLKQTDGKSPWHYPPKNALEKYTMRVLARQYFIQHMLQAARQGKYDLIHLHTNANDSALPLARAYQSVPIVYTLHDPIPPWRYQVYQAFASSNQWYVSISDAQRLAAPKLHYAATVYNGIDLQQFSFSETVGDYLLSAGRILPKKGVKEAVEVAEQVGEKLIIAGSYAENQAYWHNTIEPKLNDRITYAGIVDRAQLFSYYQKAKAFLMPIKWEEPFGLVMIEAMACGTPVIAFRRGSVPEVVVHGKTGFIVDTVEEMVAAVKKIHTIDRRVCREHVEKNFSMDKMVEGYEETYLKVLDRMSA